MEFLGIEMDEKMMDKRAQEMILSTKNSKVKVLVVPTQEELMIATDTYELVKWNLPTDEADKE